jgi:hypothetical protein
MFAAPSFETWHSHMLNFKLLKFEPALRHRALAVGAFVGAFLRAEPKSPIAKTRLSTSQRMRASEGGLQFHYRER